MDRSDHPTHLPLLPLEEAVLLPGMSVTAPLVGDEQTAAVDHALEHTDGMLVSVPHIDGAFTPLGVVIALTFVGMPFVVRTLQPVIENFEREVEESAATLGAGRLRTFLSVIAPSLLPSIITGFALAFARAIGEYGSIVFISSHHRYVDEIVPFLIVEHLDQFEHAGAMTLAVVLLVFSFALLAVINVLEQWANKFVKG